MIYQPSNKAQRTEARVHLGEGDARPRRELVCVSCGYGVSVVVLPRACPMCQGVEWRPLARVLARRPPPFQWSRAASMRLVEDAIESRLGTLLLRAIDSYESRHGTDPTVVELGVDLGIPPDFGRSQLVGRLRREVSAGFVSHYRGRNSLTAAGREMVAGNATASHSPQQADPRGEESPSEASLNST